MTSSALFCDANIRDLFESKKEALRNEIEKQGGNYLLNVSESDFVDYLVEKYSLTAPLMVEEKIYIHHRDEPDIEVKSDPMWAGLDDTGQKYEKGISITIAVPFEGDATLFNYRPSSFHYSSPYGDIQGTEILLTLKKLDYKEDELKRDYKSRLEGIRENLEIIKKDVYDYNKSLRPFIIDIVRRRKAKLLKDAKLVASLELPIKKREDALKTYSIPEIRRKILFKPPVASEKPFIPEPALDMSVYEQALEIVRGMVHVIERSPKVFSQINEEGLRQHFLVQLNGQFEGSATGETFNFMGKTDILIRKEDKNVFIAECKFWKGEKALLETIDQILGYTSWRDTKTAILLFNRGKSFSSVLAKIPDVLREHRCYKREQKIREETEFRYILHQPDDVNRELILTVMAFHIPCFEEPDSDQ